MSSVSLPDWLQCWSGRTVVAVASGPSLTTDDVEAVRASGLPAIVTNNTWQLLPDAAALLAFDARWWDQYLPALGAFAGQRLSCAPASRKRAGVVSLLGVPGLRVFGNSGAAIVAMLSFAGARRVILLGYDAQPAPDGRRHWHEDHIAPLSNAKNLAAWPRRFELVAADAKRRGCTVVNASRATALTCFKRADLASELAAAHAMEPAQ